MKNFDRLKNYALWYYFRYFPSIAKLKQKLLEKSQDSELTQKVLENILHLCDEKNVIRDKIRLYLMRNKNLFYIKQKLLLAGFVKEEFETILENEFLEENQSLLQASSLRVKITNLKNNGKSILYVTQKLIERKEDRELVASLIEEIYGENDDENLIRAIEKYSPKYEGNKLIQKLLSQGFSYTQIKKYNEKKGW